MRGLRTARAAMLATSLTIGCVLVGLTGSAGAQIDDDWTLLNDSPSYSFGSGTPVRNEPLTVTALRGRKAGSGLELDITEIVRSDDAEIWARVGFYSAPTRRPMVFGGFEFPLSGDGEVTATLVERAAAGTTTSAEVWEDADEDFGDITGTYTGDGVQLTIKATGSYRKLLRDPLTTLGLDLWTDEPGTNVQPSARVSIGDLTGSKPGLLPLQGTGVATDGSPQPWITRAVDDDFSKWRVRVSSEAENPQLVHLDIGKCFEDASQIRLFVASQFSALPPGSSYPPYDMVVFGPSDAGVPARFGGAFTSTEVGEVQIEDLGKGSFTLRLADQLHAGFAALQVVVPGEEDAVLLATGYQVKF